MARKHRRKRSNPNPVNPHRRHRSHRRHHNPLMLIGNPSGIAGALMAAPRQMVTKDFAIEAVSVTAGFLLPNMILPRLPMAMTDRPWKVYASKVAVVAGLSVAGNMVSKRVGQMILLGGGVNIILDLYAQFIAPRLMATAASASGVKTWYGVDAWYGGGVDLSTDDDNDGVSADGY